MEEEAKAKHHWSDREQVAIAFLMSILIASAAFFGLMLYAGSVGCGAFNPNPCPNQVTLLLISSTMNSPTNVTLQIINSGSKAVALISYNVKDGAGQVYSNNNWYGPMLSPSRAVFTNIIIDGRAFTFQSRSSYTVSVITSTNYEFSFTVQT
ncbi:MAG TPA: hypothetical protein VFE96_00045 [Candidatus Bathyarchaeia archaeon]|jgi:hypothetical protein|nr:hypothetical protein [Candidatus Bathyarchaeia archaeon]